MRRKVNFSPEAQADLLDLYDYIAAQSGTARALRYLQRITHWCDNLKTFPARGTKRDDLRPGLRVLGFERRVLIAFRVTEEAVLILRVLYGGRDVADAL